VTSDVPNESSTGTPLDLTEAEGILHLGGEVDVANVATLRERLQQAIDDATDPLLVDLSELDFIDSTGLGALVSLTKYAQQREVAFTVALPRGPARRSFEITGLDSYWSEEPS
jgi:anti-sigma B factor antagonist